MEWLFFLVALVFLCAGSYSDIKTREVPDWVNFGLISTGVGLHCILAVMESSWKPLLSSGIGLGIGVGVAFAMYYLGQWGGGDSKMLMGLGAVIGFDLSNTFLLAFIINSFFIGAAYALCYGGILALRKRKKFAEAFRNIYHQTPVFIRRGAVFFIALLALLGMVMVFLMFNLVLVYLISLLVALIALFYMFVFAKAIEKCCMLKNVSPSELTEGDWIAEEVKIKGKKVVGPKDLGISKKQIDKLKKHKIKKVLIKEGVPFVPSFLISFIITYFFGNIVLEFLTIL